MSVVSVGVTTTFTELLVVCVAVVAMFMLLRKRYDSNLPLLFYFMAVVFTNAVDRQVNLVAHVPLVFGLFLKGPRPPLVREQVRGLHPSRPRASGARLRTFAILAHALSLPGLSDSMFSDNSGFR